jgi:L-fuconolactonase
MACFGPERLIWGSDWPVVRLAGDYRSWLETAMTCLATLSDRQKAAVFGGNAQRFYQLATA